MHQRPSIPHCRGFVLVLILTLLVMGSLTFLVQQADVEQASRNRDQRTALALAEAKAALMGRAAADDNRAGSLPCPDTDGDGIAELFAGPNCPKYVGALPWRTLQIGELRDGYGERLGYATSASLRDHPLAEPINSSTVMDIHLDGSPVAFVVFSPGPPLPGQNRPSAILADYLEGSNADGDDFYVSGPVNVSFNDRLIAVSANELFTGLGYRIASAIRGDSSNGLQVYVDSNGTLPLAADDPVLTYAAWLDDNDWVSNVAYQRLSPTECEITVGGKTHKFTVN